MARLLKAISQDKFLRDSKHFRIRLFKRLDNAVHRINHYLADSVVCFVNTYPLDSDLSSGQRYPAFEQLGPEAETLVTENVECLLAISEGKKGKLSEVTFSLSSTCTFMSKETRICSLEKLRLQFLLHSDYDLLHTDCVHILIFLAFYFLQVLYPK